MKARKPRKTRAAEPEGFAAARGYANERRREVLAPLADAALSAALRGWIDGDLRTVTTAKDVLGLLCEAVGAHSHTSGTEERREPRVTET